MSRILLIEPKEKDQRVLAALLIEAGIEVMPAPDGFFALMMLEKNPPDLVLMPSLLKDMSAGEFCAIVRSDPTLEGLAVGVIATAADPVLSHQDASFDMVLEPGLPVPAISRRVSSFLQKDRKTLSSHSGAVSVPTELPKDDALLLWGSLEIMGLLQVCQVILETGRTGLLSLSFSAGQGYLRFLDSLLIDARFQELEGEEALRAMHKTSSRETGTTFRFEAQDTSHQSSFPRTLELKLEDLLLTALEEDTLPSSALPEA